MNNMSMYQKMDKSQLLNQVDSLLGPPADQKMYEIEARIGTFKGTYFTSSVGTKDFYRILEHFLTHIDQIYAYVSQDTTLRTEDILKKRVGSMPDIIAEATFYVTAERNRYTQQIRESYIPTENNAPRFYSTKKSLGSVDLPDFFTRFAKAREQYLGTVSPIPAGSEPQAFRQKSRWSFVIIGEDKNHPLYPYRIDLTHVVGWSKKKDGDPVKFDSYEVELEVVKGPIFNAEQQLWPGIHFMLELLQNTAYPVTANTIENVIKGFNLLFEPSIKEFEAAAKKFRPFNRSTRIYNVVNKPRNLKVKSLINPSKLAITDKADGERRILFIRIDGVYLLYPPNDVMRYLRARDDQGDYTIQTATARELANTVFDGELVLLDNGERLYLAFDLLVDKGTDVRKIPFKNRIKRLRQIIGTNPNNRIAMKDYRLADEGNFYQRVNEMFEEIPHKPYGNDGIILNNEDDDYTSGLVEKWKPPEQLTIDFYIQEITVESESIPDRYGRELISYADIPMIKAVDRRTGKEVLAASEEGEIIPREIIFKLYSKADRSAELIHFTGTPEHKISGRILVEQASLAKFPLATGQVVEMVWDFARSSFIPRRIRYDRDQPNKLSVATDVWNDIMNPITEDTIRGHDLIVMRKFHNIIKRDMLLKCTGARLLDIGSGRGGDMHKWRDIGLGVLAVEPDLDNLNEFKSRLENSDFYPTSIDKDVYYYDKTDTVIALLNAKGQDTEIILRRLESLANCVTIFNALTFFFDKRGSLDALLNTISGALAVDGLFMGMVMDGQLVKQLLIKHALLKERLAELAKDEYYNLDNKTVIKQTELGERHINKKWRVVSADLEKLNTTVKELNDNSGDGKVEDFGWKIIQESKFTEDPFGNKIQIHLDDTIVTNQIEYLVDFDFFVQELAKRNINLIETFILNKPELSESQRRLNELYRTFVFKRTGEDESASEPLDTEAETEPAVPEATVETAATAASDQLIVEEIIDPTDNFRFVKPEPLKILEPEERVAIEIRNVPFIRIGTIRDGRCLIAAVLRATMDGYIMGKNAAAETRLTEVQLKKREQNVDKIFGTFVNTFFKKAYEDGELSIVKEHYPTWPAAKKALENCLNWPQLELWPTIAKIFKTSIIIITADNPYSTPNINKVMGDYDTIIVLYMHDGSFETLAQEEANGNLITSFPKADITIGEL